MGVGEGEFRDSMEAEEGGIADDGDDDEGWQAGGVVQRARAFSLAPTLRGFRHLQIAASSMASII